MVEDGVIATYGAIVGSVGLAIVIYKTWRERPILVFKIEDQFCYPPDKRLSSVWNTITIRLRVDNKGERNTTIHSASISFDYKGKPYLEKIELTINNTINADSTLRPQISFNIKENELHLDSDIKNLTLKIEHTHNTKTIMIPHIRKLPDYPPS